MPTRRACPETSEGAVVNQAGAYVHEYNIKDHLGNTRVTYSDANNDGVLVVSDMVQLNHFYAFGLNMEGNWNGAAGSNKYGYNGKEWNDDFGLGLNDYGARWYASDAPRWINVDPLSELRTHVSPYQYVQNNPINAIDPTGMLDESFYKGSGASFDDQYMKSKGERMSEESDKWRNEGQSTFKWSPYGTKTYDSGGNLLNTTIDGYNVTKDCDCGGTGQPPCPTEKTGNLIEDIKNSLIYGFKAGGWVVKETSSKLDAEIFQGGGRKLLNGEYEDAGTSVAMALVFKRFGPISGWVEKKLFNSFTPVIQNKIKAAIRKGLVGPRGENGVLKVTEQSYLDRGFTHKIKILGEGGDFRLYGTMDQNGHIFYTYLGTH